MTDLFEELDRRADTAMKKVHPRKIRIVGTPLKVDAPSTIKDWMLRENLDTSM